MMKKQTLLFIALLAAIVVFGRPVNEQQALRKAQQFMLDKQLVMEGRELVMDNSFQQSTGREQAFFVFNVENQGGFVIVSGDDRTPEILGYSEHGHLDMASAPCNLRWLLEGYAQAICRQDGSDDSGLRRVGNTPRADIAPLVSTEWGQSSPYNDLCPNAEGGNCVTGCVATSMAQIINYNRWPQDATGSVEAYVSDTYKIAMPALPPTTFNWDNMSSADIARLMLYCGQSVKMDYGPGGSGAFVENVAPAMVDVFGYSKSVQLLSRDKYDTAAWEQLMYDELSQGRPMVYSGQGPSGGHSFIVCGYQDGLFYVNWGWDGNLDGYFDLSILKPGNGTDFSAGQSAVVGIQPPAGAGDITRPKVVVEQMTVSEKTLSRNASDEGFPAVTIGSKVVSDLATDATIQVGLALYDASGLLEVLASTEHAFTGDEPFTYEASVNIGGALPDGDYIIRAVNRMTADEDWLSDAASTDRYVSLSIVGNVALLQALPKTSEGENTIEMGVHTIDSITYRLVCEYGNYRAYVVAYNETEKYAGDVYVPDVVSYANMPFKVFGVDWGTFSDSPELTSLSIGIKSTISNCPKLEKLEIRQNVTAWYDIWGCDALESVIFPSSIVSIGNFSFCRNLKEIRFLTERKLQMNVWEDFWTAESMPALKDIYFSSDYPPQTPTNGEWTPNPNVTIHVPSGTLPVYKESIFKNWNLTDDQPAVPANVAWDYCGSDENASCGIAVGRGNNDVEFAMCVPASHILPYKGCKVTKIEFYSTPPPINDFHWADVEYVFLTKPGTDYLVKVPLTTVRGTWNTVVLPEPYVITGDLLFVGYGRNKALEADWANLSVQDEAFYMRVMGNDDSWGMASEVGVWEKHAGVLDWNHPLPIRFYIEGDGLPTDVLIGESEITGNGDEQAAQAPVMLPPTKAQRPADGYFTQSLNGQGQYAEVGKQAICTLPSADKATPAVSKLVAATARAELHRAANGKMQIKTKVRSRTPRAIQVLTLDWTIDNKILGSQSFETYLLPNHEETFYIDLPDNIQGRNHTVVVDVVDIDGEPDGVKANSSDTIAFALPATTHFDRRIVMEEATGTWCGWCPRGIETIKLATEKYPDNFIAIGMHTSDEMYPSNRSYDAILSQFTSVPNSFVNRTQLVDPDWWTVSNIVESQKSSADADISATALFTAADSSLVTVSTETVFGYSDNGTTDHRIAYVVLEDSVGPYRQANFYSDPSAPDNPDNYMNQWVHADYYVPMLYNDVARGIFDDYQGVKGSVPAELAEGEVYKYDYTLRLPDDVQNKKNVRIVVLLIDCNSGEILNAAQTKVDYDASKFSTIVAKNCSRSYGDENPALEFTVEGAPLDGEPEISCEATASSPLGSYPIRVGRGTVKNRFVTFIDGLLTVEKAPLVVSVGNYTREQFQENPEFVINYNGWKLGEDESVLRALPRARTTATYDSPVGEYDIVVSGGLATNYELQYVNGVLTITETTGIAEISVSQPADIYSLMGNKVRSKATTLDGLQRGVYIVNGRRVIIR